MKMLLMAMIRFYRMAVSPFFPGHCRFHPTCSGYALEAIDTHGAFKGFFLALKRIAKCHPFHKGGFDPVPPIKTINLTMKNNG